ncbi:DUF1778 domain-containing protein [Streptomyces sp. NPDC056500]|uniref:type II toxin -antitoxin system TacA 1-like antitoxin n=1 Tax=Streptomyces sp. NPDC056500 TaxID=3345840 RepID=UPI0036C45DE0
MTEPKAMSLRFPDPEQRATIAAAAKAAGVSMQEYILSAAYERATAVEATFLDHFKASVSRSHEAFAAEAGSDDADGRRSSRRDAERGEQDHAA